MEKPKKPSRKKAAKRPTATTPAGKSKSIKVQTAQFQKWVDKEKEKDAEFSKAMTEYNKDLKAYEKSKDDLAKLKEYKAGDGKGKKKK